MSLFSILRKNKQEAAGNDGEYHSRAEEQSDAVRGRGKRKSSALEEQTDPLLPEKKRARRRLIGAIALVLAAVIGLPMIFDSEPKPLSDDVDIQIPSKDKAAQSDVRQSVQRAPAATSVAASAALDQSEQIVEAPLPADKAPVAVKAAAAESKPAVAPSPAKAVESSAIKTAAASTAKPAEEAKTAKPAEDARAKAILEGKEPTHSENAKAANKAPSVNPKTGNGSYTVQVAALAKQDKINELRKQLKKSGIESYTQKVATESGERIRIRVGPFASKAEADKMATKLKKLGFNGTVVPPKA